MSYDAYQRLRLEGLCTTNLPIVRSATGSDLEAVGTVECTLFIDTHEFQQRFLVCKNLKRGIILGRDFTIPNCLGISWTRRATKRITQEDRVILEMDEDCDGRALAATRTVRIPPRHAAVLQVECDKDIEGKVQVTPNQLLLRDFPNLYCPPTVINNENNDKTDVIGLYMINLSTSEHVVIKRDQVVAFTDSEAAEVDYIEVAETVETKEFRNWIPKKSSNLPTVPKSDFLVSPAETSPHRRVELQDYNITPETKERFDKLCDKYPDVFSMNSQDIGHTELVTMDIDTGDSPPICQKPYTLPLKHYEWVQEEIRTLEQAGVIVKSTSPWASPIVVVPKKSAPDEPPRRRLCIDYRKLNALQPEVKRVDAKTNGCLSLVPLPKIDHIYAQLDGAKIFTTLDLRSGYYHIALNESSREKTAFVTPFGKYQFNMVPFGLAQAPAYFQTLIKMVTDDCKFAIGYLDDIIIFSKDEEEHLRHIEIIFQKLEAAGLKLKKSKCSFFKKHCQYLGHLISSDGIRALPEKLQSIRTMPAPRSPKEIKQFLGLAGYYRKFVPRFSELSRPLTRLTRKDVTFEWTETCEAAFQMLKDALCEQPILRYPDSKKPYTLFTDASKYGWAGILTQPHTTEIDGQKVTTNHPVSYVSGLFRGSQLNWAALTKEAYAIYMSVKKLSFYLVDVPIVLRSDHKPLQKFLLKNTMNSTVNNWAVELETYRIHFEHIDGKRNTLADTLSRLIQLDPEMVQPDEPDGQEFGYACFEELAPARVELNEVVTRSKSKANAQDPGIQIKHDPDIQPPNEELQMTLTDEYIRELQSTDEKCIDLVNRLTQGNLDSDVYCIEDGILYKKIYDNFQLFHAIYLPEALVSPALVIAHDQSGHNGFNRTYAAMKRLYYWKGMKKHILYHCKNCPVCKKYNLERVKFESQHFHDNEPAPMKFISMDLIGEFHPPTSRGNRFALTVICMFTGFTFCIPLPSKQAADVVKAYIRNVYSNFGGSTKILSDNGTEFKNALFEEIAKEIGVKRKIYTPPYRPQSNGRIEGFHKFLKNCIGKHVAANLEWDEVAPLATAAYNFFPNQRSKESAFFMMFGRDPLVPLQTMLKPRARYLGTSEGFPDLEALQKMYKLVAEQTKVAKEASLKRNEVSVKHDHKLRIGDMVLVKNHIPKAFEPKYNKSGRIIRFLGKNQLEVRDTITGKVIHAHITDVKRTTASEEILKNISDYESFGRMAKLDFDPAKIKAGLQKPEELLPPAHEELRDILKQIDPVNPDQVQVKTEKVESLDQEITGQNPYGHGQIDPQNPPHTCPTDVSVEHSDQVDPQSQDPPTGVFTPAATKQAEQRGNIFQNLYLRLSTAIWIRTARYMESILHLSSPEDTT